MLPFFIGTFSCEITIPLEIVNTAFSLDTISPNIFNGHNKTSIFPEYQTAGTPLLFFPYLSANSSIRLIPFSPSICIKVRVRLKGSLEEGVYNKLHFILSYSKFIFGSENGKRSLLTTTASTSKPSMDCIGVFFTSDLLKFKIMFEIGRVLV